MVSLTVKDVAENQTLTAVARASMALALPTIIAVTSLGGGWLSSRFETIETKLEQADKRVTAVESSLTGRVQTAEQSVSTLLQQINSMNLKLTQVETKQTQESLISERFQRDTSVRLESLQDLLRRLDTSVTELSTTMRLMGSRVNGERSDSGLGVRDDEG